MLFIGDRILLYDGVHLSLRVSPMDCIVYIFIKHKSIQTGLLGLIMVTYNAQNIK